MGGVLTNCMPNNGGDGLAMTSSCNSGVNCMSASANGCCRALGSGGLADSNMTLIVATECADTSKDGVLVAHGIDVTGGAANTASCENPEGSEVLVHHG